MAHNDTPALTSLEWIHVQSGLYVSGPHTVQRTADKAWAQFYNGETVTVQGTMREAKAAALHYANHLAAQSLMPDSISADTVASTEGQASDDEPCSQCWGIIAQPGIAYVEDDGPLCDCATPVPYPGPGGWHVEPATPAAVRPCPGLPVPAAIPRPVVSSFAGLASFRVGIAV